MGAAAALPADVAALLEEAAEAERRKARAYYELQRLAAGQGLAVVLAERDRQGAEGFTLTSAEVRDRLYRSEPDAKKRQARFDGWKHRNPPIVADAARGTGRMQRWNWEKLMEALRENPKAAQRGELARLAAEARRSSPAAP